jgi:integrase
MPKLTEALLKEIPYASRGQEFIRDSEQPGFALRVTKGTKSFVLEKRVHGRMRRLTLGRVGRLSLEEARQQAIKLTADISRGAVPERLRTRPTFGELVDLYLEHHVPHKRSGRNDRAVLRNYLLAWRPRKLTEIVREDIESLHSEIGQRATYQANRVVALLRKMFNLATDWGLFTGNNPAAGIVFHKEEKRTRFLQPAELPRMFHALQEEKNEYVRLAFVTAILTGARREEVLTMKWEDINFERAMWRVPQPSGAPPHIVPLPGLLMSLLQHLSKHGDNPYVFVGDGAEGHLVNVKRAWQRIRRRAEITDVRLNDLRRTFAAWLAAAGEGWSVISQALNFRSPATTAVYAQLKVDPIREALERNAKRMVLGGGKIGPAFAKQSAVTTPVPNPLLILTAPSKVKTE